MPHRRDLPWGAASVVNLVLFLTTQCLADDMDPKTLRHATFATIADVLPRPRIEALVERIAACTGINLGANFSRTTAATGMLMVRDGAGYLLGLSATALALVEPTRSGTVFATIGNERGTVGTMFRLVALADKPGEATIDRDKLPIAIAGGSMLDDAGARHFLKTTAGIGAHTPVVETGSDAASIAVVAKRRARAAVIRDGIGRPELQLPQGVALAASGPTIPLIGFARSTLLSVDDAAAIERCMFSFRFEPSDIGRLGGADRFVPLDSGAGLTLVREIGRLGGARFDRWNYFTARQIWR